MNRREILRILDANLNRSREGLRVCEEVVRFVLQDKALTARLKKLRHAVSHGIQKLPASYQEIVAARDVRRDVGKKSSRLEHRRKDARGLFIANMERAKESLRVLEEISKLIDVPASVFFKKMRFGTYAIEHESLRRLETLRDHR